MVVDKKDRIKIIKAESAQTELENNPKPISIPMKIKYGNLIINVGGTLNGARELCAIVSMGEIMDEYNELLVYNNVTETLSRFLTNYLPATNSYNIPSKVVKVPHNYILQCTENKNRNYEKDIILKDYIEHDEYKPLIPLFDTNVFTYNLVVSIYYLFKDNTRNINTNSKVEELFNLKNNII